MPLESFVTNSNQYGFCDDLRPIPWPSCCFGSSPTILCLFLWLFDRSSF